MSQKSRKNSRHWVWIALPLVATSPARAGVDELYAAACSNDVAAVTDEILLGTPIEPRAMNCAIENGANATVGVLLDAGFGVDTILGNLGAPLHVAIRNGNEALVTLFLDRGANPNLMAKMGTPLARAIESYWIPVSIVERLIDRGADMEQESTYNGYDPAMHPVSIASARNATASLEVLIRKGADVNSINSRTGRTPIFYLSAWTLPDLLAKLNTLARAGADLGFADPQGILPFTTSRYSQPYLEALARFGADLTRIDGQGENVLFHVDCDATFEYLAGLGVAFDIVRPSDGQNLAHHFVNRCGRMNEPEKVRAFKFLIAQGADMTHLNHAGLSPAMAGVDSGAIETSAMLVELGADPAIRDKRGQTLLHHIAAQNVSVDQAELILDALTAASADFDVRDPDGNTPLMTAAYSKHARDFRGDFKSTIIDALSRRGADLKLKNDAGKTACDLTADPGALAVLASWGGCL